MKLSELQARPQQGPRIIYTTDWHARGRPPRNRIDNYRAALIEKLQWCINAGNSIGAEPTMVCGGDIFDVPTPNLEVADEIVDLFISENWQLATALGNHDLDGGISTALRTVLGHLMRRGFITLLPLFDNTPLEIGGMNFWGHHYTYGNHNDRLIVERRIDKPSVIVSHSMILHSDAPFDGYSLFKDVITNADVLLLGHYHPQQPITELPNEASTIIAGPGALMRGSLSKDDISRTPSMAVIEMISRTNIRIDYIDIECSKPAQEIFKMEAVAQEKLRSAQIDQFAGELDNFKAQALDAAAIIESIASSEGIEEPVRSEALRRLGVI